ncbi:hypothetical protein Ddye_002342 [Dipteronia dyeriana]|uniref:Uncharacterized protein n=1 Tax=Dipteronia dyeriana TaxID=168575 RepID=A0AAD9XQX6_9ROSI|nr:hypothetical protein Ddye_002342 [Dipteronia dyeriana]
MQAVSPILSLSSSSPSFNSYSSTNLVDIAARVVEEFRHESGFDSDIYGNWETESFCTDEPKHEQNVSFKEDGEEEEEEEEEFEFAFVCRKPDDSPISADEIFFNGQIKPIYPLFDTSLLLNHTPGNQNPISTTASEKKTHRLPLRKLMNEDRETTATATATSSSCSSSEADDLENLKPGTYCVWKPEKGCKSPSAAAMSGSCKKSNSTGSSKRWKFRDLLFRSNSDGKDTFVFLAPHKKDNNNNNSEKLIMEADKGKGKVEEEHYVKKNRGAIREEDKKRSSYLPYRQDLIGFFNNVNGLSKNLHPF